MAIIDDTYTIRAPCGSLHEVNIIRYNLGHIADGYVECEDGHHVKARLCMVVGAQEPPEQAVSA